MIISVTEVNSPIKEAKQQEGNNEVVYLSRTRKGTMRYKMVIDKINDMKMKLGSKVTLRKTGKTKVDSEISAKAVNSAKRKRVEEVMDMEQGDDRLPGTDRTVTDVMMAPPILMAGLRYDMVQPAEYSKNSLNTDPFWEKASAKPPLEWSKWAAIYEMTVFAKGGIEEKKSSRNKPPLVEPTEPIRGVEINGETDAQRKNREVRNREKRVGWENHVVKAPEKSFLCNSFRWDEADAKVRSYSFLCLGPEGQRQTQQKQPGFVLHAMTTRELITTLEDIFVTTRIVTYERYNFICRKQKKTEALNNFMLI